MQNQPQEYNREGWLAEAVNDFRPWFAQAGYKLPAKIHVSTGWPTGGARVIGACFYGEQWEDGAPQIFISPTINDHHNVLGTLAHELLHTVLGEEVGHGPEFARAMHPLGLSGKPTDAGAGQKMQPLLDAIVDRLGPYPHPGFQPVARKKQKTRLLKIVCPNCGYTIRVTSKWLDTWGFPTCPCGEQMMTPEMIEAEAEEYEPLHIIDRSLTYETEDGRFTIVVGGPRISMTGKKYPADWCVLDNENHRLTRLGSRTDTLGFIKAVREGVYEYPDEQEAVDPDAVETGEPEDEFLEEGEFEIPDYPEDMFPDIPGFPDQYPPEENG